MTKATKTATYGVTKASAQSLSAPNVPRRRTRGVAVLAAAGLSIIVVTAIVRLLPPAHAFRRAVAFPVPSAKSAGTSQSTPAGSVWMRVWQFARWEATVCASQQNEGENIRSGSQGDFGHQEASPRCPRKADIARVAWRPCTIWRVISQTALMILVRPWYVLFD